MDCVEMAKKVMLGLQNSQMTNKAMQISPGENMQLHRKKTKEDYKGDNWLFLCKEIYEKHNIQEFLEMHKILTDESVSDSVREKVFSKILPSTFNLSMDEVACIYIYFHSQHNTESDNYYENYAGLFTFILNCWYIARNKKIDSCEDKDAMLMRTVHHFFNFK